MASTLNNNWNSLIKPSKIIYDSKSESSDKLANIIIEPLERGFGLTLGNALRRVLLSSLRGSAIVGIKIPGVSHEFCAKPGIKEDMIDVILNLKKVSLKCHSGEKRTLKLNVQGPAVVTAGMIETNSDIEILNPNQIICTVSDNNLLEMELFCETGRGYQAASIQDKKDQSAGYIAIDALFSPIKRVSYKVEDTRIGQVTDYDKLSMGVETDGSVTPEIAIGLAAKIIQEQLQAFICFPDEEDVKHEKEKELEYDPILLKKVDDLELSVRSINCLRNDNIVYIGDLVTRSEAEMLRTPNFGRKSLNEIKDLLSQHNLKFNMEIPGWPPENIEELAKKYEDKY